jgi:outer membrane protein assembly factor BamA
LTPGGDSVGGDLYYRTTLMASLPAFTSVFADARAFGFLAAGTCVRQANLKDPLVDVLASTRASVGVGLATTALAGSRLEVTYAWPLRYAPVDARRNFQFGIGLSLG